MTSDTENSQKPIEPQAGGGGGVFQTILKELSSPKLATAVGCVIVLACILGTLLPQGAAAQGYIKARPDSASLMKFLISLGMTNVFRAWWFVGLLVFFALNVTACLTRRTSARLRAGSLGIPGWGFLLTHLSILLILVGAVIRGSVGETGHLELQEGQTSSYFLTSGGPVKMPFDLRLVNFDLEYYEDKEPESENGDQSDTLSIVWPDRNIRTQVVVRLETPALIFPSDEAPTTSNAFRVVVARYVPDFVIDLSTREVGTRSENPRNPAILVNVEGHDLQLARWLFSNFPDSDMLHASSDKKNEGNLSMRYVSTSGARLLQSKHAHKRIKSFKSTLQIMENGKVLKEKTIEVNSPLSFRGFVLYQSGYNPNDLTFSTLQVVHDPGVIVVYTGFMFMIAGLVLLLCFKPAPRPASPSSQPADNGDRTP